MVENQGKTEEKDCDKIGTTGDTLCIVSVSQLPTECSFRKMFAGYRIETEYLKVVLLRLNVGLPFKSWFSVAELYAISKCNFVCQTHPSFCTCCFSRAQTASSCARASTCSVMAKDGSVQAFLMDSLLGGVSDAVAKILWTAPIERARLVVQTQDANPKIRSGEVPRYTGIVDFAQRTLKEQDLSRSWDGNFTNCLRYFPTQAFNLAYKENLKKMLPKYNPKTELWQFFGANRVSDYARTRLASDVGSGKATFTGLGDCIVKTAKGPGGFFALYTGFGVSVYGINRGLQLGTFDTSTGLQQQQQMQDCFRKIAAEEGRGLTVFHAVTRLWSSSILE